MYDCVSELKKVLKEVERDKEELNNNLSNFDKEITDILHQIEFGGYNASQGAVLTKSLREVLRKRREVKDRNILVNKMRDKISSAIKSAEDTNKYLERRAYKPRTDVLKNAIGITRKIKNKSSAKVV